MRVGMRHSLGFIYLVPGYAPSEMYESAEKGAFYDKFNSLLDLCFPQETLIVFGDFRATTGRDRASYELCSGHHLSGTRKDN